MSKYCGKCGIEMADDDFLCPRCGAIWGDRIYRVPTVTDAQEPDTEETEVPDEPQEVRQKKQPRWLLPLVAGCILLAFVLFLIGSDWDMWAGEGSTAPSTTDHFIIAGHTTAPPEMEPAYITYTVKIQDPLGNPVPDVKLSYPNTNPFVSSTRVWQITDRDGAISFQFPSERSATVKVEEIPQGYTLPLLDSTYYFTNGATDLIIVVQFDYKIEIDPVFPMSYSVTMLDPAWLYEELKTVYHEGEIVELKIIRVTLSDVGYMMFINGVEIQQTAVDGGPYLLYQFVMPEEDVVLDLKIIADREHEGMIRDYYLQYPDAENIEVIQYYGQYGMADVLMLSTASPDSAPYQIYVGKYCFKYPNQNVIQVLAEGKYISFYTAYESGFFSQEDLEEIYLLHTQYFWDLYIDEVEPIE